MTDQPQPETDHTPCESCGDRWCAGPGDLCAPRGATHRCPVCGVDQAPRSTGVCRTPDCSGDPWPFGREVIGLMQSAVAGRWDDYSRVVAALDALPDSVRAERERRGLSLRAAAAEVGIGFNSLTRLERGRNSTLAHVRAAAAWLSSPSGESSG